MKASLLALPDPGAGAEAWFQRGSTSGAGCEDAAAARRDRALPCEPGSGTELAGRDVRGVHGRLRDSRSDRGRRPARDSGRITGLNQISPTGRTAWARNLAAPVRDFLSTETGGAAVLLFAAVAALIWANSPWPDSYESVWTTKLSIRFGDAGHLRRTCGNG